MGIYWEGVTAVAAMYAAFLIVGWLAARKVKEGTAAELIVAGRAMPLWVATLTMTATWVDGGYLLGTAEGVFTNLPTALQGGLCFGISLILGGLFFAKKMRHHAFTTLIDPFEARFGRTWAAVLFLPAMLGEVIWSASLLVAIGATFGVILNLDIATAIWISAGVVTLYTMVGGMWSVAYTDVFQLALIPLGMLAALPFALEQVGGLETCFEHYCSVKGPAAVLIPPLFAGDGYWTAPVRSAWWDMSAMLVLGGIPWNCYFQRVLSCQSPTKARWHSIFSGVLTILLMVPPLMLGLAAFAFTHWPSQSNPNVDPAQTLPLLLRWMVPGWIGLLGLAAIVGAVTSSFSASILSAGSMFSWNVFHRLCVRNASLVQMKLVIRSSIVLLGLGAVLLALRVGSVQKLWFFCADLIFVLLFPQLVMALYDRRANRIGSIVAFAASLILRLGAGEPLLGLPAFLDYSTIFADWLPGAPSDWVDADSNQLLPFRVSAMLVGLMLLPIVSRLTGRIDPPQELRNAACGLANVHEPNVE